MTASILSDGSDTPYRLSIASNRTGKAGRNLLWMPRRRLFPSMKPPAHKMPCWPWATLVWRVRICLSPGHEYFYQGVLGATITVEDVSIAPVTVKVATSNTDLSANIKTFVEYYNKFRRN